jgi:hypothetical protein
MARDIQISVQRLLTGLIVVIVPLSVLAARGGSAWFAAPPAAYSPS